jgi:molybdopterin molybdotransferase
MLTPTDALSLVLSRCKRQPIKTAALDNALGRILARPVRADRDLPPADRSTMDGFAVRADDLRTVPCELRLVGEVAAGSAARPRVGPATCARILTGANLPLGADSVAIVETTEEASPRAIRFHTKVACGQNIIRRGEHAQKGQVLLDKGTRLRAQQLAVCASVGMGKVAVYRRPRVGVLCTGRELVAPSARAGRHLQRDSNGPALRAALQATGLAECRVCGVVDDVPGQLRRRVRAALNTCDVVIVVGGVSVGKYDFVPAVLGEIGCRTVFHRVRMKPGKPILFALGPDKQLIFGLPGNPLSALTGFYEFVLPALKKVSGTDAEPLAKFDVRLAESVTPGPSGRIRYYPARLHFDPQGGAPMATPVENEQSADVVAGGRCDGVLVLPEEKTYARGSLIEFHPWGAVEW